MRFLALCLLLLPLVVEAAEINQLTSCSFGTSWNTTLPTLQVWDPDGVPTNGHSYVSTGEVLRSPDSGTNPAFGGDALTIGAGSTLGLKNSEQTVPDLRLDGGIIGAWIDGTIRLHGGITVESDSDVSMGDKDGRIVLLDGPLAGNGGLTVRSSAANGQVRVMSASNTYSGAWNVIDGCRLNAGAQNALGAESVSVVLETNAVLNLGRDHHTIGALTVGGSPVANGVYTADELNVLIGTNSVLGTGVLKVGRPTAEVLSPEADTFLRKKDDGPHGAENSFLVKNSGTGDTTRNGIVRFKASSVRGNRVEDVRLHLTVGIFNDSQGATSAVFNVFGIVDGHAVETFLENDASFTYNDMPGLDNSGDGINDGHAVWRQVPGALGGGTLLHQFTATKALLNTVLTLTDPRLTDFVRSSGNVYVTLFFTRQTNDGTLNTGFASREHSSLAPPHLEIHFYPPGSVMVVR